MAGELSEIILTTLTFTFASYVFYKLYLGPLHSFPGPTLWALTQLPWHINNIKGRLPFRLEKLHQKYGPIVRIGPNELSLAATSLHEWKTIYAHRPREMVKSLNGTGLPPPVTGVPGPTTADEKNHPRQRKGLAPAFSEKALRDQEVYLIKYIDKLMAILHRQADSDSSPFDLAKLFNLTTFDLTGELTFGESFGGLDEGEYHPWIGTIMQQIRAITIIQFAVSFGIFSLLNSILPKSVREQRDRFWTTARERLDARIERKGKDRRDFMSFILANSGDPTETLTIKELHMTSAILIIAGSETSATHLSGTFYFLLQNRKVYNTLCEEIRSSFRSPSEINMSSVVRLKYITCVMNESFRLYPPAPSTIPRIVPEPGEHIHGQFVPAGTVVGINQWSTNHSASNFRNSKTFAPERWLLPGERPAEYDEDHRDVLQPFSYGNRNCIGQGLANVEIRLILCRILYAFDVEDTEQNIDWMDQKAFLSWDKKPLMVRLSRRDVSEREDQETTL